MDAGKDVKVLLNNRADMLEHADQAVREAWNRYYARTYPRPLSEEAVSELRAAFFAGAEEVRRA